MSPAFSVEHSAEETFVTQRTEGIELALSLLTHPSSEH
jgi:hypothetical protein